MERIPLLRWSMSLPPTTPPRRWSILAAVLGVVIVGIAGGAREVTLVVADVAEIQPDLGAGRSHSNCRVSDTTRSGSRMTFKIACTGNNPMTGTGDFTFGANGYNGQIRIKGKMEGQDVDMTQAIDARRVGGCTTR